VFDLATLLDATKGRVARGSVGREIVFRSGCFDSRQATADCLFFALRGERDGHDFVADALARGARGAVVSRIPDRVGDDALLVLVDDPLRALRDLAEAIRARHPIPAVGITGSVGKTTTKEAAAAALGARYRVLKSPASFNNEIGVPMTFLAQEPSHDVAVLEMGFYVPGEIADLSRLVRQRGGIVTAVPDKPVHFARTPSVDAIARGKAELVEALPADGTALLNADDRRVRAMSSLTRARVVLFGSAQDAELRARDIPAVIDALRYAHSRGVVMVGAAGNEGQHVNHISYPARDRTVISAGATTSYGCQAYYSSFGDGLDVAAPGGGGDADLSGDEWDATHCSAGHNGRFVYQQTFDSSPPRKFHLVGFDGTSEAAPHVSAIAALVIASGRIGSHPAPDAVMHRIEQRARDAGPPGYDKRYGYGLVDAAAAVAP
jgi:hypothetical protein